MFLLMKNERVFVKYVCLDSESVGMKEQEKWQDGEDDVVAADAVFLIVETVNDFVKKEDEDSETGNDDESLLCAPSIQFFFEETK